MTLNLQEKGCNYCGGEEDYGTKPVTVLDEGDLALAKEMNDLSVEEREKVLDDIHGVAKILDETPEFLENCFKQLDVALTKVPKRKRKALDRATFFKPSIQQDSKFKLMFLRADLYDADKAAKRMAKYFDKKLSLFGETKLVKRITLADLLEEDLEILNAMACVILPHRDQTGRPIWFFDKSRYDFSKWNSMFRCLWYQVMATVEDDDIAQLKGICDIVYYPGNPLNAATSKMGQLIAQCAEMFEGFPCRVTTCHFCYDDLGVRYLVNMGRMTFGKEIRLRTKAHFGSDTEIQYSLLTYGIHCQTLMQAAPEEGRKQIQNNHIVRRRQIEQQEAAKMKTQEQNSGVILYPQPDDVLIGRGHPYRDYPGNLRLGRLIDSNLEEYLRRDRFGKTCLSMDMVQSVQDYGGRFIERNTNGWKVLDDAVAREKAAIGFRSRISKCAATTTITPATTEVGSKSSREINNGMPLGQEAKRMRCDVVAAVY